MKSWINICISQINLIEFFHRNNNNIYKSNTNVWYVRVTSELLLLQSAETALSDLFNSNSPDHFEWIGLRPNSNSPIRVPALTLPNTTQNWCEEASHAASYLAFGNYGEHQHGQALKIICDTMPVFVGIFFNAHFRNRLDESYRNGLLVLFFRVELFRSLAQNE